MNKKFKNIMEIILLLVGIGLLSIVTYKIASMIIPALINLMTLPIGVTALLLSVIGIVSIGAVVYGTKKILENTSVIEEEVYEPSEYECSIERSKLYVLSSEDRQDDKKKYSYIFDNNYMDIEDIMIDDMTEMIQGTCCEEKNRGRSRTLR